MGISARSLQNYQVEIQAGKHRVISDEPVGLGDDTGPEPFNLFLGSLASCTIITLHMYARRKNWPLESVQADFDLDSRETLAEDGSKVRSSIIHARLSFHGDLTQDQIRRLEDIASRCPVHRMLRGDITFDISAAPARQEHAYE